MKKLTTSTIAMLFFGVLISKGQTNTFPTTGNAGIGTTSPTASLNIIKSYDHYQPKAISLFFQGTWASATWATDFRFLDIASSEGGKILQLNGSGMGIGYDPPVFESPDKLYVSGNVGIGTNAPTEKLSVKGKIRAQEIKVETANWPDYVFAEDYTLSSLEEVEKHIKAKGHLPGIPSAGEVKTDGIALGEMNAKLLEKIEQLTLHLIEQNKRIISLQEQQKILSEQLKTVKK